MLYHYGLNNNAAKQATNKPTSSSEVNDQGQQPTKPPKTRYSEGYNPSVVHLF